MIKLKRCLSTTDEYSIRVAHWPRGYSSDSDSLQLLMTVLYLASYGKGKSNLICVCLDPILNNVYYVVLSTMCTQAKYMIYYDMSTSPCDDLRWYCTMYNRSIL